MKLIAIIIIWSFHDVTHGPACIAFQCSHLYITSDVSIRAMEGYTLYMQHHGDISILTTGILGLLLHPHKILCIIIVTMKNSLTVSCGSCTNQVVILYSACRAQRVYLVWLRKVSTTELEEERQSKITPSKKWPSVFFYTCSKVREFLR